MVANTVGLKIHTPEDFNKGVKDLMAHMSVLDAILAYCDVNNLEVTTNINNVKLTQPVLHCKMNKVPTYKTMIDLQAKRAGEYEDFGSYYEV